MGDPAGYALAECLFQLYHDKETDIETKTRLAFKFWDTVYHNQFTCFCEDDLELDEEVWIGLGLATERPKRQWDKYGSLKYKWDKK